MTEIEHQGTVAMGTPDRISRELLGKIVDEVFDGAIEDASVIEDIYAAIKKHETPPPQDLSRGNDAPLTISLPVHQIAHDLLKAHTGQEGGCPKIDWYRLRSEISDAIAVALDNQRKIDIPPAPNVGMPIASWREQAAFEDWANDSRYEMAQHPLHYLFMDKQTNAARQGWKAALAFVRKLSEGSADA